MVDFINELCDLAKCGDYGNSRVMIPRIVAKISASADRYVDGGFSWSDAVSSEAPALVFRGACNDVARFRKQERLPEAPTHFNYLLRVMDMRAYVQRRVESLWEKKIPTPCDQLIVNLPGYYSKLVFPADEAYVYPVESWLQSGNRISPIHADHGRVVSYIPPSLTHTFKIWVFFRTPKCAELFSFENGNDTFNRMIDTTKSCVLVQRPGDVVYLNMLVYHSVLLGFIPGTPDHLRWGAISGNVIISAKDRLASFRYATRVTSGARRGSLKAWESTLSAYCAMEKREWKMKECKDEKARQIYFERDLAHFLSQLPTPAATNYARNAATTRSLKRRTKKSITLDKMKKMRAGKRTNADTSDSVEQQ